MAIRRVHPGWCAPESGCAASALHLSRLRPAAPRGDEVIQVRAGLWQMDVGRLSPSGVLLELSAGDDPERWPIDLVQARVLVHVLRDLLRVADDAARRAA
ncbi:hypothetical protein OG777_06860 [Micromonospora peucetia]|uniref:Uncharacterized protein n=1 Tax=Micromonospora peucetia TaxID=47871 RepID=A0A1C6UFD5_9ACTN|nr:hypothetical protein [Micromonospora peucetia]MCX4386647.1 hypothetical protein [Micromonospora peucetia]WSA33979.1 hypothetical protein OIE14_08025 [Micromonospora peucetia]SCL52757.1 hypothetical protein GA0070608_1066 [Micromonospora peucetia]